MIRQRALRPQTRWQGLSHRWLRQAWLTGQSVLERQPALQNPPTQAWPVGHCSLLKQGNWHMLEAQRSHSRQSRNRDSPQFTGLVPFLSTGKTLRGRLLSAAMASLLWRWKTAMEVARVPLTLLLLLLLRIAGHGKRGQLEKLQIHHVRVHCRAILWGGRLRRGQIRAASTTRSGFAKGKFQWNAGRSNRKSGWILCVVLRLLQRLVA